MPVASSGIPGPSSSGSSSSIRSSNRPSRPPRWKQRRSSSPHRPSPSPGILSLLATLVASSSAVNGSPAPLSFLCPSVDVKSIPSSQVGARDVSPPPRLETRSNPSNVARKVPDMFTQYPDGIWRRVDAYTLYGSTVCADCREPTASATPSGDLVATSPDSNASATTSSYDIRNSLPPGWIPSTPPSPSRTTLILALSLVLAFFICFFIIGCLFWRKQKRRKHRENDVEIKGKKRRHSEALTMDEEREVMVEKEARVKQKIWARATARWKANARFSARQRRGKRPITKPYPPDTAEDRMEQFEDASSLHGASHNPSLLSRVTSISSLHTFPPSVTMAPSILERVNLSTDSLPIPTVIPTSPPAYRQRNTITAPIDLSPEAEDCSKRLVDGDRLTGSSDSTSSNENSFFLHAAHVATDDKATLARLANLASAPPTDDMQVEAQSTLSVSVPLWEDEELNDFELEHNHQEEEQNSLPYPLPPSKGKMAAPNFYDYPCSFEEIDSFEEQGPSAPPFEEGSTILSQDLAVPSAPPFNDETSAPSLEFDMIPSAPPLVDDHCMSSQSTRPSGWDVTSNHLPQSDSDTNQLCRPDASGSDPPVQGPIARDGSLPVYKP